MNLRTSGIWLVAIVGLVATLATQSAAAEFDRERGTAREAQELVTRAIELYDEIGFGALRIISRDDRQSFLHKDLYVFVIDTAGFIAAHAGGAHLVGSNALNARDSNGRYYVREMLSRASVNGTWVDYLYLDPFTGHEVPKSTWVVLHKNFLFACGIYAGDISI